MDLVRDSLATLIDHFRYETSVEHFVPPFSPDWNTVNKAFFETKRSDVPADYAEAADSIVGDFKNAGVTPQDAFNVLMNIDKDPAELTKDSVAVRLKVLNLLLTIMNRPGANEWFDIKQNGVSTLTPDMIINRDGAFYLTRRLVKLLILEASPTPTMAPMKCPTMAPTARPTMCPTMAPTTAPTMCPTMAPTAAPTMCPTLAPITCPTCSGATRQMTAATMAPTMAATMAPTTAPVQSNTTMIVIGVVVIGAAILFMKKK